VHEERLSPELGRLIDAAKSAAARVDPNRARTEVVGLLTSTGAVYTAHADEDHAGRPVSAVESALGLARAAGDSEVVTAVVTLAHDASDSVSPSPAVHRSLAALDPELPIVVKQRGRWVMLPVSRIQPSG
jgi:hypothetical protein